MISQKSNRVAAIKNRFENLNDTSENDFLIKNSRNCDSGNRATSPIKRQLIKQSSAPIVTTLTNNASTSTNKSLKETKRKSIRHKDTFRLEKFCDHDLPDEEKKLKEPFHEQFPNDSFDSSSSEENSNEFHECETNSISSTYNEINEDRNKDDAISSLRSLSRQSSDPGKKLQRSHAFRCDRSQKVTLSPKRHSSCNGRTQNNINNAPTLRIGEKPRLSRERLKKLGLVLEERMKRDNFSKNNVEIDKENVDESSFVQSNNRTNGNTSSFLHSHLKTKSFLHQNNNAKSCIHSHVNKDFLQHKENTTLIRPCVNTSFLHPSENSTSFIHANEDTSSFICSNENSLCFKTNVKLSGISLSQDNKIPQHILDQYAKVIKPKKSNLMRDGNTTEIISQHPDPMTDSGVSSETENTIQDNDISNEISMHENLKRKSKLMKLRAQIEELADSAKDTKNISVKCPKSIKSISDFKTKHISVPANDTDLLMEPNLCDSKDGLNSSSETIKKLAVKNPHIVLTDTLKKALKQPLPDGPPPKKPPRIFAANSIENESNLNEMSPIQESIETNVFLPSPKKSEQDCKSMLEKIEKALMKHNDSSKIISPRYREFIEDKIEQETCENIVVETRKKNRKEIHYMCTEILDLPYNKETEVTSNKLTDVLNVSKCFSSLNCTVATNRSSGSIAYARLSSGSCSSSNRNSNICCSCSGDSTESLHEHSMELENRSKFSTFFNIGTSQNETMCRKCGINMGKVDDEFRCHLGCKCEELKIKKESSRFHVKEFTDKIMKLDTEGSDHIYAEPFQHSESNEVGCAEEKTVRSELKSIPKVGVGLSDDITLRCQEPLPKSLAGENKVKDILKRWESTGVNECSVSDCDSGNVLCDRHESTSCDKVPSVSWDKEYGQIDEDEKIYDLPCADSERSSSPESIEIRLKSTPNSSPRFGSRTIDSIRRDFEKRATSPTGARRASSSSPQSSAIRSGNSSFGDIRKSLEAKLGEATPPSTVVSRRRFEKRITSEGTDDTKNGRKSSQQRRFGRSQLDIDRENLNRLMNEIYETVSVACEMEQGSTSSSARSDSSSRTNKFPVDGADNSSEDSIKLSRSLTEKRKNYVRRVSSRAAFLDTATVGKVKVKVRHQTSVDRVHDPSYHGNQAAGSYATFRSWKSFKMVGSQNNLNVSVESDTSDILDGSRCAPGHENMTDDNILCSETRAKLFDVCLLVGMNHMTGQAYVKSVFPAGVTPPPQIENLIFPETLTSEEQNSKMSVQSRAEYDLSAESTQMYSLVLTNERGERSFGYCRRVLPEGATFCLPLAYCMVSQYRAPGFYYKVLREIESNHGGCDVILSSILQQLYKCDFPEPGSCISVSRLIKSPRVSGQSDLRKNSTYRNSVNLGDVLKKGRTLPNCQGSDFKRTKDDSFKGQDKTERSEFLVDGPDRRKSVELVAEYFDVENNNVKKEEHIRLSLARDDLDEMEKHILEEISIKRPIEPRVDENNLSVLLDSLGAGLLMEVFGTLLLERKVVLTSPHLSQLSSCMEALQQILYPFVWQHPLISTIPSDLKRDLLEAPIPILAGLLTTHAPHRSREESKSNDKIGARGDEPETAHFEEGMLIDLSPRGCSHPRVVFRQGDEASILAPTAYKTLKTSLNLDQNSKEKAPKAPDKAQEMEKTRNVLISEAFLRFFVDSLGEFSKYFDVKAEAGRDDVFEKEKFIKSANSKNTQYFLEWFTETAMFNHFISNMTLGRPRGNVEMVETATSSCENVETNSFDETKMVDLPYKDFYRTFDERIVNSKVRNGAKCCKKTSRMGGDVAGGDGAGGAKTNYKNIVNKKVKSLKNKLKDLVN